MHRQLREAGDANKRPGQRTAEGPVPSAGNQGPGASVAPAFRAMTSGKGLPRDQSKTVFWAWLSLEGGFLALPPIGASSMLSLSVPSRPRAAMETAGLVLRPQLPQPFIGK